MLDAADPMSRRISALPPMAATRTNTIHTPPTESETVASGTLTVNYSFR